jgi:hypothetical protein
MQHISLKSNIVEKCPKSKIKREKILYKDFSGGLQTANAFLKVGRQGEFVAPLYPF